MKTFWAHVVRRAYEGSSGERSSREVPWQAEIAKLDHAASADEHVGRFNVYHGKTFRLASEIKYKGIYS